MKFKIITLLLLVSIGFTSQSQIEIFKDSKHVIHFKKQTDSLIFVIEVLNDNTINLSTNSSATTNDDFVQLMFDYNASDGIDFGSQIDLIYQYDSTLNKNICASHITGPSAITTCGTHPTNAYSNVKLGTSVYLASSHLIWTFGIPLAELETANTLFCGRLSVNIHTAGDPLSSTVKIPASSDTYFVDTYNAIMFYKKGDIGDYISACVGDKIYANDDYPEYFWNTALNDEFAVVVNFMDVYGFVMSDNTCIISDSVKVNIINDAFCTSFTYSFPNVLSPNDDNLNDTFQPIIGQDLLNQDWTGAKLKIYNRWGVSVYESPDNAYPVWDVRNEVGDIASSGTYFYTFMPPGDNALMVNGFFMILSQE